MKEIKDIREIRESKGNLASLGLSHVQKPPEPTVSIYVFHFLPWHYLVGLSKITVGLAVICAPSPSMFSFLTEPSSAASLPGPPGPPGHAGATGPPGPSGK